MAALRTAERLESVVQPRAVAVADGDRAQAPDQQVLGPSQVPDVAGRLPVAVLYGRMSCRSGSRPRRRKPADATQDSYCNCK